MSSNITWSFMTIPVLLLQVMLRTKVLQTLERMGGQTDGDHFHSILCLWRGDTEEFCGMLCHTCFPSSP